MKKQVKKISKKILVLGLATSIIFTSCFSHKKIDAHASSVAVGLGAYTLYEICLYIGGLAITTLGLGYAYENRDEIAQFGKTVIDTMTNLPSQGWILGSKTSNGDYVYGTQALQEVQNTDWTVIQGGGQSPKKDNDNDGDEDIDDVVLELNTNGYFLTQAGVNLFQNRIKPIFKSIQEKHAENVFNKFLNNLDKPYFEGYELNESGNYVAHFSKSSKEKPSFNGEEIGEFSTDGEAFAFFYLDGVDYKYGYRILNGYISGTSAITYMTWYWDYDVEFEATFDTNLPLITSKEDYNDIVKNGKSLDKFFNLKKTHQVADWINNDDDAWKGHLEDIATSLRSLQDMISISQRLAQDTVVTQPSANDYGDMMESISSEYMEKTDPIVAPIYYPSTNTTPTLQPSDFPNYQPPSGGSDSDGGSDEDIEIDLDGLTSIFNIIFYLIMIIIMLIYLFISCLAFIVMIFRIPASSSMLPQDMVLGYEHLQTIMIPGMNISIYSFAMAIIYLFIIFAIIKLIRLEINDFKFPRSYK